jgi:hypothetical protein
MKMLDCSIAAASIYYEHTGKAKYEVQISNLNNILYRTVRTHDKILELFAVGTKPTTEQT